MTAAVTRTAGTLAALALFAPEAGALQQTAVLAVLPFEDGGSYGQEREVFEALEVGLPVLLARVLERGGARVVDPERVREALAARRDAAGRRLDAGTAAALAREVGATHGLTGSFADFYGRFRITVRVVDARSGEILRVVSNDDPALQERDRLAAVLHRVGAKVGAAVGVPERSGPEASPLPFEAITDLSRGLVRERGGDRAGALEFYRRALSAAPGFEEAEAGVRRTQER